MQSNEIKKENISNPSKVIIFSPQQQKKEKDHYDTDSDIDESDLLAQPITNKNQLFHLRLLTQNSYLKLYFERLIQVFSSNQEISSETHRVKNKSFNMFLKSQEIEILINSLTNSQKLSLQSNQTNRLNLHRSIRTLQNQCRQSLERILLKSKRFSKTYRFAPSLIINQLQPSNNYEVVKLSIHYLWYTTQICILNVQESSSLHDCCKVSNWGTFGSVYFVKAFDSDLAVKCIKISKKQRFNPENQNFSETNLSSHFISVIKEYFFLLFFSELEIGLKVKTIGGFDMVFYESCIQFSTEICLSHENNSMKNELSQGLFTMHMFQVVHRDIKPQNIMYSPTFGKAVFIDFGCTQILNQKLGQKTLTQFIGTSAFCTDEVVNLLSQRKGTVDLYYNDFYGLNASLQKNEISQNVNASIHKVTQSGNRVNILKSYDFLLHSLKHSLYFENLVQFLHLWRQIKTKFYQEIEYISFKLLSFFSQLKPNQHLAQFYWTQIDESIRDLPSLQWLKIFFKIRLNEFVLSLMRIPQKTNILAINQLTYRVLHVQNSKLTKNQKQIQKILLNRLKVKNKIYQITQDLKSNLFTEKTFQSNSEKLDKLCTIVAFYSSFTSNQFNSSIDQKVKTCQSTLRIIKKFQNLDFDEILVFNTPFKHLSAIVMFHHYFIFKVWKRVPQKFKSPSMVASFITFCLLGYPISNNFAAGRLTQAFVSMKLLKQYNDKLSLKSHFFNSTFYLECRFLIFLFGLMFCSKNSLNNANFDKLLVDKIYYDQDIIPEDDRDFLEINTFNTQLMVYFQSKGFKNISTKLDLDRILKQLNSQKIKILAKKYQIVKKWRTLVQITTDEFSLFHEKTSVLNTSRYVYQNSTMFNEYKHSIMLPFIGLLRTATITMNAKSLFFERVDEIIGSQQISINFKIDKRLTMAIQNKNFKFFTQIADYLESKTIQTLQFHILLMFDEILEEIIEFIKHRFFQQQILMNNQYIRILKQVFRIYKFLLKMGYNNFQLINQFFYEKFKTLDHLIDADLIDLGMENDRSSRDFIFYILQIGNFFINVKGKILNNFTFDENMNFHIEHKYIKFMNNIKSNPIILFTSYSWSKLIQQNCYIKKIFCQSKSLSNKLLNLFRLQRLLVGQISDMHKILKIDKVIEFLYQKIEAKMFQDQQNWNKMLPLDLAFEFYQSKLFHSNYETYWCEEVIKLYQICEKRNLLNYVFGKHGIMRNIFNSLVYLERKPEQFEHFFIALTSNIKEQPTINKIQLLSHYLSNFFWCKCQICYARQPKFWNPNRVIQYMYSNIDLRYVAAYPYMSLVYYFSMMNKILAVDENYRKVIKFILKSIPYLTKSAKSKFQPRIYLIVLIMNNPELKTNQILFAPPALSIQQSESKFYRQFIRYYLKYLKNRVTSRDSLQQTIQQTFFREKIIVGFKIPKFARKQYANKLRKYYQVKENYQKGRKIGYQLPFSLNHDLIPY